MLVTGATYSPDARVHETFYQLLSPLDARAASYTYSTTASYLARAIELHFGPRNNMDENDYLQLHSLRPVYMQGYVTLVSHQELGQTSS